MYFEGCLSFNVIQQNGLMSLCGSLPITQDHVSPKCSHQTGPLSLDVKMDFRIFTTVALSPL